MADAAGPGPGPGPGPGDGGDGDGATRPFGPRPPRALPPRASPRPPALTPGRRRWAPALALAGVAGAAGAVALVVGLRGPARPEARACPAVAAPVTADVDGDGCASALAVSGNVVEVEGRRYELGQPGDVVVVGDWDCDGRDTPALYRRGGAVFFFDGWAEEGRPLPAASRGYLPDGEPEVRRGDDGCDRLVVR